jgi:16S rRNA (cytidine1402-2'-O)-methyltransferase
MGILSIVATPIGNLEDISIRALRTLFHAEAIACEDTRRTGTLLRLLDEKYHDIIFVSGETYKRPDLISYYEQNELSRIPEIINALKNGLNIALISDAGTPAISDPGFKLIRECLKESIRVESIPGPSSVISALVISGLPTDKFLFIGYPPRKPGHRKDFFEKVLRSVDVLTSTVILFESPHKLLKTLEDMLSVFGDIEIVICRELTKVYESKRREKISESLLHYRKTAPKGEYVLVFHPKD